MSRKKAVETPIDWEDKYWRMKTEYDELQAHCNSQTEDIRKLKTKTVKLESDFNNLLRSNGGTVAPSRRQDDEFTLKLEEENKRLKGRVNKLIDEIKGLKEDLDKKKREVANLKRINANRKMDAQPATVAGKKRSAAPDQNDIIINQGRTYRNTEMDPYAPDVESTPVESVSAPVNMNSTMENTALLNQYKARMQNAERLVNQLRKELQDMQHKVNMTTLQSSGDRAPHDAESAWRLQQLQTQYDHLQSRAQTQDKMNKDCERKLEEYAQRIRDLRRALEDLRNEKEITDIKANRVEELEDQTMELRKLNRNLEDKISKLCEAPFINDAFGKEEARMRYEEVATEREEFRIKVEHLQEAVKTQYSALVALKQQASKMMEEKNATLHQMDALRVKYKELEETHQMVQVKLRLFSGKDDEVDMDALERALTLVKRRNVAVEKLDIFRDDVDLELYPNGIATADKKMHHVQEINLRLTKEVERLEAMLRIQSDLNKQLHKELAGLVGNRDKDKKDLIQRCEGFEEMARKRLEKVHMLEAQVRQLVYGGAGIGGGTKGAAHGLPYSEELTNFPADSQMENPLLNVLIDEKNGEDIQPDENLLEVWIKGATLRDGLVQPGTSTFVCIDFFDYESQATSLLSGSRPQWDFAATYKITVDDFLLRCFATDVMTFEINMAKQGDFALIARCTIPLSPLLQSKPILHAVNYPMISTDTGAIVANITVDIRLAMPVFELYRLFLERHPEEEHQIREIAAKRAVATASLMEKAQGINTALEVLSAVNIEDESRLYNEMDVDIIKVSGISSRVGGLPSPYVHFQFLGFPDKFTTPQENTLDPVFNQSFSFPMVTNDQQLRLLRRSQLVFTVIDMKSENTGDDDDVLDRSESRVAAGNRNGVIGEVNISLSDLVMTASSEEDSDSPSSLNGGIIEGSFDIKNPSTGQKDGVIDIKIHWRAPLRTSRQLGTRALSGMDVERIISCFSANSENDGLVSYRFFCRMVAPPLNIRRVMEELRRSICRMADMHRKSHKEICCFLFDSNNNVNPDDSCTIDETIFVESMLKLQLPSTDGMSDTMSNEILPQELVELFRFIDLDEDNCITIHQLLAMMNLLDAEGLPAVLFEKLRDRVRDMEAQNISVLALFESIDRWGADGIVSRHDFKQILKQMGFILVDEATDGSAIEETTRNLQLTQARGAASAVNNRQQEHGDMMNDAASAADDVLLGTAGGDNLSQIANERKAQFEAQVREAEARSEQAAKNGKQTEAMVDDDASFLRKPKEESGEAPTRTATLDPFPGEHHVSVQNKDSGVHGVPDERIHSSAVKLQSRFRGYRTRKASPSSGKKPSVQHHEEHKRMVLQASQPKSLLMAEDSLRKCFVNMRSLPDFQHGFETVDTKRTGFVNRMQFAHVMRQFPALTVEPEYLRAFMDFFDVTSKGTGGAGDKIDYQAFIRFCKYKSADALLPTIKLLNKMILHHDAVLSVKKCDHNGNGYVNRANMMRVLANSGYLAVKESKLLKMLRLFETVVDGEINYGNFIEYLRETNLGRRYDELVTRVRTLLTTTVPPASLSSTATQTAKSVTGVNMKGWFDCLLFGANKENSLNATVNKSKNHRATFDDLLTFLRDFELVDENTPKEVTRCLFISMDVTTEGISVDDLHTWVRNVPSEAFYSSLFVLLLNISDIQRKSQKYLNVVQSEGGEQSVSELHNNYLVYDYNASGLLPKEIFIHATKNLSGFPFTYNELRSVASEFLHPNRGGSHSDLVNYKKFLEWIQPAAAGIAEANSGSDGIAIRDKKSQDSAPLVHKTTAATLSRFLEDLLHRGVDLISVFGRYDPKNLGRVSIVDFVAGLADLGMSAGVSSGEVTTFADTYRAVIGEFILYRRLVSEILQQLDEKTGAASGIDVVDHLAAVLQRHKLTLEIVADYFEKYDRKNVGRVKEQDLSVILLDELGLFKHLKQNEVDALTDKFAVSNGWVQYTAILSALQHKLKAKLGRSLNNTGTTGARALSDEFVSKCRGHLEELILRGVDFRDEFEQYDIGAGANAHNRSKTSGSAPNGLISPAHFKHVWQDTLRCKVSVRELDQVEVVYRQNYGSEDALSYVKFLYDMHPIVSSNIDAETWIVAEELRKKIRRKCPTYIIPSDLSRTYRHFSKGGSKENDIRHDVVTLRDLSAAIRQIGMKVNGHIEQNLFNLICLNGGRNDEVDSPLSFNFTEFYIFVCDSNHRDLIWKIRRLMNRGGKHNRIDDREMYSCLSAEDSNGSKLISPTEFQNAMKRCEVNLSDSDVRRLLYRFGSNVSTRGNGNDAEYINIKQFMKFIVGQNDLETVDASAGTMLNYRDRELEDEDFAMGPTSRRGEMSHRVLYKKLKERVEDKLIAGFSANEVYAYFDNHSVLDIGTLLQGMRDLGLDSHVSREEAKSLLRQMCSMVQGTVDRSSFFDALDIDLNDPIYSGAKGKTARSINSFGGSRRGIDANMSENDDFGASMSRTRTGKLVMSPELETVMSVIWGEVNTLRHRDNTSAEDALEVFHATLTRYDENADGNISQREFSRAVASLKLTEITNHRIIQLFDCLDMKLSGMIPIDMFMRHLQWYQINKGSGANSARSGASGSVVAGLFRTRPDFRTKIVDNQLRVLLEKNPDLLSTLKGEYRRMDITHSGLVSASEIAGGLYRVGVRLQPDEEKDFTDSVANAFDDSLSRRGRNTANIAYDDFVAGLANELEAAKGAGDLVEKFRRTMTRVMQDSRRTVEDIFEFIDRDLDGQIDVLDFEKGLTKLGSFESFERGDVRQIFSKMATGGGVSTNLRAFTKFIEKGSAGEDPSTSDFDTLIRRIKVQLHDKFGSNSNTIHQLKFNCEDVVGASRGALTRCSKRDFLTIMTNIKANCVTRDDADLIFDHLGDREGDVTVLNLNEFIKLMDSNTGSNGDQGGSSSPTKQRSSYTSDSSVGDVMATIRSRLQMGGNDRSLMSTGSKKIGIVTIENALADSCSGNSRDTKNMVSMKQFSSAMEHVGIRLRATDVEGLFKSFAGDRRRADSINYRDFVDALVTTPRGGTGDGDRDGDGVRVRSHSPSKRDTSKSPSRAPSSPMSPRFGRSGSVGNKNERK